MKKKRMGKTSYDSDACYFDDPEDLDIDDMLGILTRMKGEYGADAVINPKNRSVSHFELESDRDFSIRKERAEAKERATYEKLKAKFEK